MEPYQIGVCTWSLQIAELDPCLAVIKDELGLRLMQLGFMDDRMHTDPQAVMASVQGSGIEVSATCVGFAEFGERYDSIETIAATGGYKHDETWPQRLAKTQAVADITRQMGVKLLTVHIGFVPHGKDNPYYKVMVDRVKEVSDMLGERGLIMTMETGQERAADLADFIAAVDRKNLAVNFDPANMVLYGVGDPIEAVEILGSHIQHVHMKDGTWSDRPGVDWGADVPLGSGQAKITEVLARLKANNYTGPLSVEREAGDRRIADVKKAIELLEAWGASR